MPDEVQAYERNSYLREVPTRVTASGDDGGRPFVVLEDTVFYPEGGGQPCDLGTIEDVPVREVRKVDGDVRHYVDSPLVETSVRAVLDWRRRYDHMQQHTAQHLLSALFLEHYGWATTSFHLGENRCDIELDVRGRGLPTGHAGSVRLVEIEGVDTTTCGGTHLGSTAEIESIHLGPVEAMRGGSRLDWVAGGRVRRRLRELEDRIAEMRTLFETSEEDLAAAASARIDSLKDTSRELRRLTGDLAEAHVSALAASPGRLIDAHFDGLDGGFLANVGRALADRASTKIALLTASSHRGHFFLIAAGEESGVSLAAVGPKVAAVLGGRGGGSGTAFQGKAESLENRSDALDALRRSRGS